jgi:mono/diheme cytochrome c family protein
MPRWVTQVLLILLLISFIPLAMVARQRLVDSGGTRLSVIPDMDKQEKVTTQSASALFADGRGMRPPVPGAVARGDLREDDAFYRGKRDGEWIESIPLALSQEVLDRGRERYAIFCAPCHGASGYGNGSVHARALDREQGTWTQPSDLHSEVVAGRPAGYLFNAIGRGVRNMPAYDSQIPVEDRWAIVAYVKALQRSRNARLEDLPPDQRTGLE